MVVNWVPTIGAIFVAFSLVATSHLSLRMNFGHGWAVQFRTGASLTGAFDKTVSTLAARNSFWK